MQNLFVLALLLCGCGHDHAGLFEPNEYTGCTTDEHWRIFDDQEPLATTSATLAPTWSAPSSGGPISTKPVFRWTRDANNAGAPDGDVPYMNGPGCDNCCPQFNRGALQTAHLPSVSGNLYDLQFTVGASDRYRVLTSLQEWTPPDAVWIAWRGQAISVTIYRMALLKNDVKEGPYKPAMPLTFTITVDG